MIANYYQYYNYLGAFYPYYFNDDRGIKQIDRIFLNQLKSYSNKPELDEIAILEVLKSRFMLGDRTIIKGINRSPWMARPSENNSEWEYFEIKKHGKIILDEKLIADKFFKLVCNEIKKFIKESKKIGILLSGGMDSRIVAGCLDYLLKTDQIGVKSVTAYTWGNTQSRDVVYAKAIANRLNWKWKHYKVSSQDLWENFKISGYRGAEYSGIHLHAIPQIKKDLDVDLILAGSYGDSMGRGEYGNMRVDKLKSIKKSFSNFNNFLRNQNYNNIKNNWKTDIQRYHKLFPREKQYQQNELDFQIHYMRRMLNSCFEILNEKKPTYQVFTSPEIYQFIWSLDPSVRKDKVYKYLMEKFETKLSDVPWARTGLPYLEKGESDSLTKNHHSYSHFIQNDLINKIEERVLSKRMLSLNIFNARAIKTTIKLIKLRPNYNFDYLERLTWLVSLDFFLEQINYEPNKGYSLNLMDLLNAYIIVPARYLSLNTLRRYL